MMSQNVCSGKGLYRITFENHILIIVKSYHSGTYRFILTIQDIIFIYLYYHILYISYIYIVFQVDISDTWQTKLKLFQMIRVWYVVR